MLNVTKYHKTNKIENMDLSCDVFKQFKVADLFEDTELYLQTEKILEERVRHTLLRRVLVAVGCQKSLHLSLSQLELTRTKNT